MISHSCPTSHTLHMIKHDPSILQIPYKLHSCHKTCSTPRTGSLWTFWKWTPFVLELVQGNNILKCSHINSWTSIQGCYQYNHHLDNVWKKQWGYECRESSIHKTCPKYAPTTHL
jgi:hypothetical protein